MRITCVIDDAVQRSSGFWGEHGLAFLIEAEGGRVLFDTGQSGTVLMHNLNLLEIDPASIDAVAISHAHYDHTGGLDLLMGYLEPDVPLYANPDLFRERFSRSEGEVEDVGIELTEEELDAQMALRLRPEPQEMVPGVWTTGEITERPEAEGSSERHLMREGGELVSDTYGDDMALVLELGDHLALLCGCCHAGLLNTLAHVERAFDRPVEVVAGGLHLTGASPDDMQRIEDALLEMESVQHIYPNHCTGEGAFIRLMLAFGPDIVHPCPAGTALEL